MFYFWPQTLLAFIVRLLSDYSTVLGYKHLRVLCNMSSTIGKMFKYKSWFYYEKINELYYYIFVLLFVRRVLFIFSCVCNVLFYFVVCLFISFPCYVTVWVMTIARLCEEQVELSGLLFRRRLCRRPPLLTNVCLHWDIRPRFLEKDHPVIGGLSLL